MNVENINFCQPDIKHYCVECCRFIKCELLGPIDNEKLGCTIHPNFKNRDASIRERRPICKSVNCWEDLTIENKQKLFKTISEYKTGEFRMTQAKIDSGISTTN